MKKYETGDEAEVNAAAKGLRYGFRVFGPMAWYVGTEEELHAAGLSVCPPNEPKRPKRQRKVR